MKGFHIYYASFEDVIVFFLRVIAKDFSLILNHL